MYTNFEELEKCIFRIKQQDTSKFALSELKNELNKFFIDCDCKELIYTENTDGMFFGVSVHPYKLDGDNIDKRFISATDNNPFAWYRVELDSKLFSPLSRLNTQELLALIVYEISQLTNTNKYITDIRDYLQICMAEHPCNIVINKESPDFYVNLFKYAITKTLRLISSIFEVKDLSFISNDFIVSIGYNRALESAYDKISTVHEFESIDAKYINLEWAVKIYSDLEYTNVSLRPMIADLLTTAGSKLEQDLLSKVQDSYKYLKTRLLYEGVNRNYIKESNFIKKIELGGLRSVEEDLYEYNIRIKNVENEIEAIDILRGINYRINLIDDYILYNDLSDSETKRWEDVKLKFITLRENLMKTSSYKKKFYGLYQQYDANGKVIAQQ